MKTFLASYRDVILRIISALVSFVSCIGLLVSLEPKWDKWGFWHMFFAFVSVGLFIVLIVLELKKPFPRHVYSRSDKAGIIDYMHRWISLGGRVAIWSRDLSWATDDRIRPLLIGKAKAGELIICVPRQTDLTRDLQLAGAEIRAYAPSNMEPSSRFTIIDFGKDGSRVAVGRTDGEDHVIEEFAEGGHPAFHLAGDLVELAKIKSSA
jgi:hypothetical protein